MTKQLPLALFARARSTDPATSKVSAAMASQFDSEHYRLIMQCLQTYGQGTIYDIAGRTALDPVAVARRLPELEKLGAAVPTNDVKPGPRSRRPCRVWRAA